MAAHDEVEAYEQGSTGYGTVGGRRKRRGSWRRGISGGKKSKKHSRKHAKKSHKKSRKGKKSRKAHKSHRRR